MIDIITFFFTWLTKFLLISYFGFWLVAFLLVALIVYLIVKRK